LSEIELEMKTEFGKPFHIGRPDFQYGRVREVQMLKSENYHHFSLCTDFANKK